MGYGSPRQSPSAKDDMLFAVGWVVDGEIKSITGGPYAKVGSARSVVTLNNRRYGGAHGKYQLIVTAIDWKIIDE